MHAYIKKNQQRYKNARKQRTAVSVLMGCRGGGGFLGLSSITGFGVCLYERIRLSVGSIPWWRDFVLSRSYSDRMCQLSCKKSSIFSRPSPSPARLRFILPLLPIDSPPPPSSMSHSDPTWVFSRTNVFNQTTACSDSCRIARHCKPAADGIRDRVLSRTQQARKRRNCRRRL